MPSVSRCPQCEQQVSIPPGVPGEITVRCPLCSAEYPLADALATLPPMLVPVGLQALGLAADGSAHPAQVGAGAAFEAGSRAVHPADVGVSGVVETAQAADDQQLWGNLLAEVAETEVVAIESIAVGQADATVGQPAAATDVLSAAATQAPDVAITEEAAETAAAESQQPGAQSTDGSTAQSATEGEQPASGETAGEGFSVIEAGATGEAALPISIKARPSRSREVNPLVHIGGMVVFGVVGLGLGYYFSNLLFGPRMDFLRIPLPFVRHTYKHWGGGQGEQSGAETGNNGAASEAGASRGGSRTPPKPQQQPESNTAPRADEKSPSAGQDQAAPQQPSPDSGGGAKKEPDSGKPSGTKQQPKQPPGKAEQPPDDEPMQLPGDLPDIRGNQPIEEPELEPPPKPETSRPASRAEL